MEITTTKSAQFIPTLIDAISNDPKFIHDFEDLTEGWAKGLVKETLEGAVNCRKYFTGKPLSLSITISLGELKDEENY